MENDTNRVAINESLSVDRLAASIRHNPFVKGSLLALYLVGGSTLLLTALDSCFGKEIATPIEMTTVDAGRRAASTLTAFVKGAEIPLYTSRS